MNLPLHLRHRAEPAPAVAWLSENLDASSALRVCSLLGLDPSNHLFEVAGALLVRFDQPTYPALPLGTRLRALVPGGNLLLPVDADLTPSLLDEEAEILGRRQGLIFLHGGRVLAFDPLSPIPLSNLIVVPRKPTRPWTSLPRQTPLADTIREWVLDLPRDDSHDRASDFWPSAGDEVLEPGGEGIASDPAPMESADARRNLRRRGRSIVGRAMLGLGRSLGWSGLQALGRSWLGHPPLAPLPAPGGAIEGRQAEALRALLREFREGDPERALRHALPFREAGDRPLDRADRADRLPEQTVTYSLGALLGPSDRGPASLWTGSQDLLADLVKEYRRAAQRARDRGDFRRAAFILGRLLQDYSAAAQTLLAGGLYRDAAILYLARLDDPLAAARAFEAACEFERALALYRRQKHHEEAGDLLRKIGRTSEALLEYQQAAVLLTHDGTNAAGYLGAGNLMLNKALRDDLALEYFLAGWNLRDRVGSLSCALEAASRLPEEELTVLTEEVDAFFLSNPQSPVRMALWYNRLAFLSEQPERKPVREALLDRARLGLARSLDRELQTGVRPAPVVASLFTPHGHWSASFLRDAEFAARDRARQIASFSQPNTRPSEHLDIETGEGKVIAWTSAPAADMIYLGFQNGSVVGIHIAALEMIPIAPTGPPVVSIATDPGGLKLATLRLNRGGQGELHTLSRLPDGRYRETLRYPADGLSRPWLTPILSGDPQGHFGIWDGVAVHLESFGSFDFYRSFQPPATDYLPRAGFLLSRNSPDPSRPSVLPFVNHGHEWSLANLDSSWSTVRLSWRPSTQGPDLIRNPIVSASWSSPHDLELVMLTEHGAVGWAAFHLDPGPQVLGSASRASRSPEGFRAACLVRPGLVAGVTHHSVDLFRHAIGKLTPERSIPLDLPDVVAVSADSTSTSLCLVTTDGRLRRLPLPL